jgi:hypothetical protein
VVAVAERRFAKGDVCGDIIEVAAEVSCKRRRDKEAILRCG